MTKQRLLQIFKSYVNNDYEAAEEGYVADILLSIADECEIRELGLGWIIDENSEDD